MAGSDDNRRRFVSRMQPFVRARIEAVERPEQAARGADLICCASNSNVPVLFGAWLEQGQHVTSITPQQPSWNHPVYACPARTLLTLFVSVPALSQTRFDFSRPV